MNMKAKSGFRTKFYPNGEFTCGYVAPNRYEEPFDADEFKSYRMETAPIDIYHAAIEGMSATAEMERDTIGLSIPANSHRRRGLLGVTLKGQRFIRNAAYLMQADYKRTNLSFLTLTVPSVTVEESKEIARNWSEIVRVFCQRLKRKLESAGLPGVFIGVTEIQTKRWIQYGTVGLHLHILFKGRERARSPWVVTPKWVREAWLQVIEPYWSGRGDTTAVENIKQVEKDAGAYLSKYMSKGAAMVDEIVAEHGEDVIPRAWYTATLNLKQRVAAAVVSRWAEEYDLPSQLPYLCATSVVKNVGVISITIHGRDVVIGYSGSINEEKAKLFAPELFEYVQMSRNNSRARQVVIPGLEYLA